MDQNKSFPRIPKFDQPQGRNIEGEILICLTIPCKQMN